MLILCVDVARDNDTIKRINSTQYRVRYTGQSHGRQDHRLLHAIEDNDLVKVYIKKGINVPFIYLGSGTMSSVVRHRTVPIGQSSIIEDRLEIEVIVDKSLHRRSVSTTFEGTGRFKRSVLEHAGVDRQRIESYDVQVGFYRV